MIVSQGFETLIQAGSVSGSYFQQQGEIDLAEIMHQSKKICDKWETYYCDNEDVVNFRLTDDMEFVYKTTDGQIRKSDITQYAFGQLCSRLGVPANYVQKCFENGKASLAVENFKAWAGDCEKRFLIREQDGVVRAVLSDSYSMFDSHKVLRTIHNTVDMGKYKCVGAFLAEDSLNVRLVDRKPLDVSKKVDPSPIYSGAVISSSDVGRKALSMSYFLFRQICNNGMTVTDRGGTLFRQAHVGSSMTGGKIEMFNRAFMDIDTLNAGAIENMIKSKEIRLGELELQMYLEKAKRELKLSQKAQEELTSLIDGTYDRTRWGVLNGITELAQNYTLETRIAFETFAGNAMMKAS